MKDIEAARLMGFEKTFLSQLLSGRRSAGLATAITIERHTGIPAEAWLPTDDGKSDRVLAGQAHKAGVGKR